MHDFVQKKDKLNIQDVANTISDTAQSSSDYAKLLHFKTIFCCTGIKSLKNNQ